MTQLYAPVHYLETVASTQDALHALAADGALAGTAVVAAEQTAGRGSRGRPWHSPRGGLWLSVLLRPPGPIGLEVLSLRVGLVVAEVLGTLPALAALPAVALKWPNDLVLDDRKLGGVLCEARWHGEALAWVAVGLGLNVVNPLPASARPAARLADHCPGLDPRHLAEPLASAIAGVTGRGEVLEPAEVTAFAARDWLRGRELRAPAVGRAVGIGPEGALIVRAADGADVPVRSGSVVTAEEEP